MGEANWQFWCWVWVCDQRGHVIHIQDQSWRSTLPPHQHRLCLSRSKQLERAHPSTWQGCHRWVAAILGLGVVLLSLEIKISTMWCLSPPQCLPPVRTPATCLCVSSMMWKMCWKCTVWARVRSCGPSLLTSAQWWVLQDGRGTLRSSTISPRSSRQVWDGSALCQGCLYIDFSL